MYLLHTSLGRLFLVKPLAALSVVMCLVTIVFCFSLRRRQLQHRSDRFLVGFLGIIAIYQGLHILQGAGVLTVTVNSRFDGAIELVIATFYLIAVLMLRLSSVNRLDIESAMRLARAAPPRSSGQPPIDLALQSDAAALASLRWALPRLSDNAFKLYVFLCLRAGNSAAWSANAQEVRLQTGKTKEDLETALGELQRAGAVTFRRRDSRLEIEIAARDSRSHGAMLTGFAQGPPAPVPEIVA